MFHAILLLIFNPLYAAVLLSLAPFKEACGLFQAMVNGIDDKFAQYQKLLKEISAAKRTARADLAKSAFPILSAARAYCIKNKLFDTAAQLNTTLSELRNMSFLEIIDKCQLAISLINPLVPNLTAYNVTAASMLAFTAKLKTMKDLMGTTGNAAKQRHNLGVEIETDMSAAMTFFNTQLVPLNNALYETFPKFYTDFQSIKRIGSPNVRHTRLNAHCVTDLGTCPGVTVTVDAYTDKDGKVYEAVSAIADLNGDAEVAKFFAAQRTVTISGAGVVTTTFPAIQFVSGKATDKNFVLLPSFDIPVQLTEKKKVNS